MNSVLAWSFSNTERRQTTREKEEESIALAEQDEQ